MATEANIRLPDDLLAQITDIAAREGKTPDEMATEAIKREVARRLIAKLPSKPSGMTEEEEIEAAVRAVHDYRRGRQVKVVLDTNILISGLRYRGKPREVIQMGVERTLDVALSPPIVAETLRVLRDKFQATPEQLSNAETIMEACGRMVHPTVRLDVAPDDPNDNHIVETAVAAGADAIIITGDKDLLRLENYQGIRMVRVSDFLHKEHRR